MNEHVVTIKEHWHNDLVANGEWMETYAECSCGWETTGWTRVATAWAEGGLGRSVQQARERRDAEVSQHAGRLE